MSELGAASTQARTLAPLRRDRNPTGGELPDASTQTGPTLDRRRLLLVHSFPVAGAE